MNAVALICARGGSKGLPGKNIKPLAGKPLIGWAIEHARAAQGVTRVIVSTDAPEIAQVAKDAGAEVPFLRPAELARDDSPEWLVWRHALTFLKDTTGTYPDALVCVPTTAPLRTVADIDACIAEFKKGDCDVVLAVSPAHRSPYFNMVKVRADGLSELVIPPAGDVFRRQDAPVVYDISTICYVARPEFVMTAGRMFDGRVRQVVVPSERALDIDTPLDFRMAELLVSLRGQD